jgi:hypothetical protein
MKRNLAVVYAALLVFSLALPYVASAAINSNVWSPSILSGPLVTCTGNGVGGTQCQNLCDLIATIANVIYYCIGVVIWIITPIMVAWAGILMLMSRGSPEKVSSARKMLTGIMLGLLIVLCAYLIVYTFVSVLGIQNSVGGFGTAACTIS